MYCNLKVVIENGWQNCNFVNKYNFGEVISNNSTVKEFEIAIKKVSILNKENMLYQEYLNDAIEFENLIQHSNKLTVDMNKNCSLNEQIQPMVGCSRD
jgi:hypothetical protein